MKRSSVWKTVELKIARFLGGDRNPITGRVRDNTLPDIGKAKIPLKSLPDIEGLDFEDSAYQAILAGSIFNACNFEIKHRKDLPKYLLDIGETARKNNSYIVYNGVEVTTLYYFRNFYLTGSRTSIYQDSDLTLPSWLLDAKNQADMSGDGKMSVVILHAKNKKIKDSVVLIWSK